MVFVSLPVVRPLALVESHEVTHDPNVDLLAGHSAMIESTAQAASVTMPKIESERIGMAGTSKMMLQTIKGADARLRELLIVVEGIEMDTEVMQATTVAREEPMTTNIAAEANMLAMAEQLKITMTTLLTCLKKNGNSRKRRSKRISTSLLKKRRSSRPPVKK
jgi:hypothetical protein